MIFLMTDFKKLRETLNMAQELCNFYKNEQISRYGSAKLHITDIVDCSAKLYADRTLGISNECGQLSTMRRGTLFENDAEKLFNEYGYTHRPVFFGTIISEVYKSGKETKITTERKQTRVPTGRGEETRYGEVKVFETSTTEPAIQSDKKSLVVIAEPDYIDNLELPNIIVDIRTIGLKREDVENITKAQRKFIVELGIFPNFYVPLFQEGVYSSDLIKYSAYMRAISQSTQKFLKPMVRGLYIYKDSMLQYDFNFDLLNDYYDIFIKWIPKAFYAILHAYEYGHGYDINIFDKLVKNEIATNGILNYFKCNDCGYLRSGICKGLPPLHKHNKEDQSKLKEFREYWNNKGYNIPILPFLKSDDKADFHEVIEWTKEVRKQFLEGIFLVDIESLKWEGVKKESN